MNRQLFHKIWSTNLIGMNEEDLIFKQDLNKLEQKDENEPN